MGLDGPTVDPLGEELIKPLPEGLRALLAPAVALPAPVLPPLAAPVVVPLAADPLDDAPPVEPPLCANAALLANASAAAKPTVAIFIDDSPDLSDQGQMAAARYVPALAKTLK